ncbi:MAG: peptidylprolyl isomerase, partial [bacterium]|nr:peptidylprolyl isomerase [bacterium]
MKNTLNITFLFVLCLALAWAWNSTYAMPGMGKAATGSPAPAPVGGASGSGVVAKEQAETGGNDPLDSIALPDNVLKVDGVPYSGDLFKKFVREVMEEPSAKRSDFARCLNEMALDVAGYDAALKEMPELKDDASVARAVAKLKSRLLPSIFYLEEVRDKVNPTPEELLKTIPDPPAQYDISAITNQDEGQIDSAGKALAQGEPFDNVARLYSDGLTAHKGGKVGSVVEGKYDLFSELEFRVIKSLKDGETSKPFMSRIGWTIVRLDKFWSSEALKRLDVEENYPRYKAEAEKARSQELYSDIQKRYSVVWNDNNLARIRAAVDNELLRTDDLRSIEIFRVDGIPVYAPDFFDAMAKAHSSEALELYLDKRMRSELLSREAERLGYAGRLDPLVDLARRRAVTREFFRRKSVGFQAGEKELREYYEKNREKYRTEEARRLFVIETPDRKKADEVYSKAKKGGDFRKLARNYAYKEEQRIVEGDVGYVVRKNMDPVVGDKIFRAKVGSVLKPMEIPAAGGGTVFAVVKVDAVRKRDYRPYDQVNKDMLRDKIVAAKMSDYYKEFIDEVG